MTFSVIFLYSLWVGATLVVALPAVTNKRPGNLASNRVRTTPIQFFAVENRYPADNEAKIGAIFCRGIY